MNLQQGEQDIVCWSEIQSVVYLKDCYQYSGCISNTRRQLK